MYKHLIFSLIALLLFAAIACRLSGSPRTDPTQIPGSKSPGSPDTPAPGNQAASASETPSPEPASPSVGLPTPALNEETVSALEFATGPNEYVIDVDQTPRKFLVYVPESYDPGSPTPLIFMFHGSNQGGPLMFRNTSWAAHADANGFLVVFPTSWKYELIGEAGLQDKWNTFALVNGVERPEELKDDVKFTRMMVELMEQTFNIDPARIYATGFSNGGGFVLSRMATEMNDVFAAYAISGNALWRMPDLDLVPEMPAVNLYVVIGSNDDKISEGIGAEVPYPLAPDDILAHPVFSAMLENSTQLLSLSDSYEVSREQQFTTFTYADSIVGADNVFKFRMVKGMFHVYANGDKVPKGFDAAELFWAFFIEHPRE